MSRFCTMLASCLGAAILLAAPAGAVASPASSSEPVEGAIERVGKEARQDPAQSTAVAEPLRKAREALNRARGAREAGDQRHAPLLEQLAAQWVSVAAATGRAIAAEAAAELQTRRGRELRTKLERSRALLTEQQARRGRLQTEVREAEKRAKKGRDRAAAAESRRLDQAERRQQGTRRRKTSPQPAAPKKGTGR